MAKKVLHGAAGAERAGIAESISPEGTSDGGGVKTMYRSAVSVVLRAPVTSVADSEPGDRIHVHRRASGGRRSYLPDDHRSLWCWWRRQRGLDCPPTRTVLENVAREAHREEGGAVRRRTSCRYACRSRRAVAAASLPRCCSRRRPAS